MLQQAHPGVAAAADILLGQAALNTTGKSLNSSQAASASNGSEAAAAKAFPDAASGAGAAAGTGAEGQAKEPEIPWRQVAGLLHSQGVTDPQGLVSTLCICSGWCDCSAGALCIKCAWWQALCQRFHRLQKLLALGQICAKVYTQNMNQLHGMCL